MARRVEAAEILQRGVLCRQYRLEGPFRESLPGYLRALEPKAGR